MRINHIFYSLQGEGFHTGVPAVFVRLAGCNLKCSFCDTEFDTYTTYTKEELAKAIAPYPSKHLIFTGGEPALQLSEEWLLFFKEKGYIIHVETNGTTPLPKKGVDWVTCSPKTDFFPKAEIRLTHIDELKVIFDGKRDVSKHLETKATHYFLQPCDVGNESENATITQQCVDYILKNPKWKLSLQTHKLIHIL